MTRKLVLCCFFALPVFAEVRLSNPDEINQYLARVVDTTKIPGLTALVTDKDGDVLEYAYGMQDIAGDKRMQAGTQFSALPR